MTRTGTHEVALLRLVAQRVAGPRLPGPAAAVEHLLAVQAQDLPGAMTSIALRTADPSRAAVVAAFDDGAIVRSWPMRGTLHAVPAVDLGWMVALMSERPRAAAARRRQQLGLDDEVLRRAEELALSALRADGVRGLSRAELLAVWGAEGLPTDAGRGYHLLAHLAQTGVLCLGPFRDDEQLFVPLAEWVPEPRRPEREAALAELALRYFRGHGPATVKDLMRWASLPARDVRAGLALVADRLDTLDVDGVTHHLDPDLPDLLAAHRDEARAVHLLPGFDEVVLGYADRSATVPDHHADRIVPGGNGVFRPVVVVDGVAVATWRAVGRGAARRVETSAFGEDDAALDPAVADAVTARFAALP